MPPRQGQIWLDGQDITGLAAEKIVGLGVSQVPEHRQVFGTFSVRDNLNLGAYLRLRRPLRFRDPDFLPGDRWSCPEASLVGGWSKGPCKVSW